MMARHVALVLSATLLATCMPAWGSILNPSFENGPTGLDDWIATGTAGTFATATINPPPSDGNQCMNAHLPEGDTERQAWLTQHLTVPAQAMFLGIDVGYTGVASGLPETGGGVSAVLRNIATQEEIDLMPIAASARLPGALGTNYNVYVTDVTAFQGIDAEIEFSIWVAKLQSRSMWADNIRFMNAEQAAAALAPEPSAMALVGGPAVFLLVMRRRRRRLRAA